MPNFAYVYVRRLVCPNCFRDLTQDNLIGFQWGYCDGRHGYGIAYEMGDFLRWRIANDRVAHSWVYFLHRGSNIGDPNYANVLIRESERDIRACSACNHQFSGIGIRVREGRIDEVRVYQAGLPDAEYSIINEDGTLTPRPDWDDRAMQCVDGGWRELIVPQSKLKQRNNES